MQVKRSISSVGMLCAALGGIIGSGWLFGPLYAAQIAGPASIVAWLIGGCIMMLIGLTFAELSTMFPVTGSIVRFAQFSHGTLVSFTMAWIGWISCVIIPPLEVMAVLQYSSNYLPGLVEKVGGVPTLTGWGIVVAAALMLFMCVLNVIGVRFVTRANSLIVAFKLAIPVITVGVLFYYGSHTTHLETFGEFAPTGLKGILQALPTSGIIMSFIGFTTAIALAGESKNPQRALPIAIIGSLAVCIILYAVLQWAFLGNLDPAWVQNGWKALEFKGDSGPVAGLVAALGVSWLVIVLYAGAVISPFGTGLTYTTATSRMNYGMSKNGYMPKMMMDLSQKGIPVKAIAVNFVIGMFLLMPFPTWQSMVGFLISAVVISYAVGPLALISLRQLLPDHKRPFRLPAVKTMTFTAFYVCNLIAYWTGWNTIKCVLIAVAVGYVWLAFYKRTQHGKEMNLGWAAMGWLIPYFIGLGLISYLGSFGGGIDVIAFGWDFLVIAIFSGAIFVTAMRLCNDKEVLKATLLQEAV